MKFDSQWNIKSNNTIKEEYGINDFKVYNLKNGSYILIWNFFEHSNGDYIIASQLTSNNSLSEPKSIARINFNCVLKDFYLLTYEFKEGIKLAYNCFGYRENEFLLHIEDFNLNVDSTSNGADSSRGKYFHFYFHVLLLFSFTILNFINLS